MTSLSPYINFKGTCEEAFNFYKSVFGGEFPYVGRYKDMPPSDDNKMAGIDGNLIMHISLRIGDSYIMGSDVGGEWAQHTHEGNNMQLSVSVESNEEADRFFNGLAVGGSVKMPMSNTFWGAYFGMLTDKFGINWMISHENRRNGDAHQN